MKKLVRKSGLLLILLIGIFLLPWNKVSVDAAVNHKITAEISEHGTISTVAEAETGSFVNIAVTPDDGYALENLNVTDESGNNIEIALKGNEYQFVMPTSDVSLKPVFAEGCDFSFPGANVFELLHYGVLKVWNEKGIEIPAYVTASGANYKNNTNKYKVPKGKMTYAIYDQNMEEYQKEEIFVEKNTSVYYELLAFTLNNGSGLQRKNTGILINVKDFSGNDIKPLSWVDEVVNGKNKGYLEAYYFMKRTLTEKGSKCTCSYSVTPFEERYTLSGSKLSDTCTYAMRPEKMYSIMQIKKNFSIVGNTEGTENVLFALPKGAEAKLYFHTGKAYSQKTVLEPANIDTASDDNYDIYTFKTEYGKNAWLVCSGDGTPYKRTAVDIVLASTSDPITIDLKKKNEKSDKDSWPAEDDLYTNIKENYITMQLGESHMLEGFRVQQTVQSTIGNDYIDPEMHYEIIAGDSVELKAEGAIGREYQTMTAIKPGISVIKITYDDMEIQSLIMQNGKQSTTYCNAIDSINTGIVIVNVGGTSAGIDTGINLTDFDTVYIPEKTILPDGSTVAGTDAVPYTFTPSSTNGAIRVTTHDPIQNDTNWSDGWKEQQPDANGAYTIDLKEGRNIVCIESGDSVAYRLINAKKLTTTVINTTRKGKLPQVGDDVAISFDGLELPVYKMCGIYNPGFPDQTWVEYRNEIGERIESQRTQYAIEDVNTISLHIDEEKELILNAGSVHCAHMGSPLYAHCEISLAGQAPNLNASMGENSPYFDILPDITIPVVGKEVGVIDLINEIDTTNYLGCIDKIMAAKDAYDALTDEEKAKVTNADVLNTAYEAVKDIIDVIKAVAALPDEVTLADREAVEAAQAAYAALAQERQAVVSNTDKLQKAVETMQALVARQDRIEQVIAQIGALPVTDKLTEEDEKAVQETRTAYEALAEDEKAEVTNVDTLEKAELQIRYLKEARSVSEKIAAIGDVTIDNFDEKCELIVVARTAYDLLDDAAKELVSNLDTLKKAEEAYKLTDEDVQKVIEAIKTLETPLAASKEDMTDEELLTVWNDYSYLVVNIRGLADRLSENQQKIVTNMSDLELAESYLARAQAATAKKEADADYAKAKELLSADTLPKASEYEGENPKELTTADADAVTAAKVAYDALTEEQQTALEAELPEAVANMKAMDTLLKDSESTKDYYETALAQTANNEVAKTFMADLADVYATYKDTKVTRSDITVIDNTLKQYDALTEDVKALLADAEIDGQKVQDILKTLTGWSEQVAADEKAAEEISEYIKNLPTSLNKDNMEAVRADLETIVKMYNALNDQAKTYVRRLSKVEAVNKVLNALDAEIKAFKEAKVTVTAGNVTYNAVTLNWNTVEYATSYEVYRKTANGQWTKLTETTGTSYSDQSVAASTAYGYKVIAVTDHWGQRVESSFAETGVTTAAAPVTPSKPDTGNDTPKPDQNVQNLTAVSAGYNSVRLNWSKVKDADGYRIYRATSANGTYKSVATIKNGKTTSWTNKKLTTGRTYYYKIRAYKNQNGKKVWKSYSKTVSVIPTLGQVKVTKAGVSNRKAVLKWKKVSGANGYLIYRSTSKNGTYKCVNSLSSKKTKYTSKKLAKGKTYYYKIRAYRKVNGKRVYSPYTAARQVKVK